MYGEHGGITHPTQLLKRMPHNPISKINHVGLIMDGNRRWARARGYPAWQGHERGARTARTIIEYLCKKNIFYVSVYALSLENLDRSETELSLLFELMGRATEQELEWLVTAGIQVIFVGDWSRYPASVRHMCEQVQQKTAHGKKMLLSILFFYGGQQEIVAATQLYLRAVQAGIEDPEKLTPVIFQRYLWTAPVPPPDIIIRTGGRARLSNFLLFNAAYTHCYWSPVLWPDLTPEIIENYIAEAENSGQNYGT